MKQLNFRNPILFLAGAYAVHATMCTVHATCQTAKGAIVLGLATAAALTLSKVHQFKKSDVAVG